ncbi:MAG: hypothetical protein R3A50_12320 [Saprospiraceae bacterium]
MFWFLTIFFFVFGLILFLPIRLELDSTVGLYRVSWVGIFACWLVPNELVRWRVFLRVFLWKKELTFTSKPKVESRKKDVKPVVKKRNRAMSFHRVRRMLKYGIRAIKLDWLQINWDTDDFVLNAWLYPLFHAMNGHRRRLQINFMGDQQFVLKLHTNLGLLTWAMMRVFITSKS